MVGKLHFCMVFAIQNIVLKYLLIFIQLLIGFTVYSQTYISQKKFDLGIIDSINEDVVDLNLSSQLNEEVFLLRIQSAKHVTVRYTSKRISPNGASLLRIKLNPKKKGRFSETVKLYFSNSQQAVTLLFYGELRELPQNNRQACPDFRSDQMAQASLNAFRQQKRGEVRSYYVELQNNPSNSNIAAISENPVAENRERGIRNQRTNTPPKKRKSPEERRNSPSLFEILFGGDNSEHKEQADPNSKKINPKKDTGPDSLLGEEFKPNNIIFLIDASTSMREDDKMTLLKQTMIKLLNPLREIDYLSIVTYSGEAKVLMPPTSGIQKEDIKSQIENIKADGSTQAVKGIRKAIQVGKSNFIEGGNNQIILATDGAFDIGSKNESLRRKIEKTAKNGLTITVLGIKNERWTNKSLKEIASLGKGELMHCNKTKDSYKILEDVKKKALY